MEKQEHISLIQSLCRVLEGRSNNNFLDHPNLEVRQSNFQIGKTT